MFSFSGELVRGLVPTLPSPTRILLSCSLINSFSQTANTTRITRFNRNIMLSSCFAGLHSALFFSSPRSTITYSILVFCFRKHSTLKYVITYISDDMSMDASGIVIYHIHGQLRCATKTWNSALIPKTILSCTSFSILTCQITAKLRYATKQNECSAVLQ